MNDQERLQKFLIEQKYMTLAVSLNDGTPWAVPVKIQLYWGNAFEWDSKLDTEHSKAVAKQPIIAISIFNTEADNEQFGFYAKAEARLMKEKNGFGRYQAIIKQAWINDASFVKREVQLDA